MATPIEPDLFWKIVEWLGWAIGAVCTAVLGFFYRRYVKDRNRLYEHQRELAEFKLWKAEVDRVRKFTDDGRLAFQRLDQLERQHKELFDNQKKLSEQYDQMNRVLIEVATNVRWLCKDAREKHC